MGALAFNQCPGVYLQLRSHRPVISKYSNLLPINRSEDEKIHYFKAVGPLSNGKHEFTERVAAFLNVLEQATPVDKNEAFVN